MASATDQDVHQCSNCSNPATHTCKACKAMPNASDGTISSAWYCGAECQKAHWAEHKAQCKAAQARQVLYRAGALAQQLFYHFSKTTYMWCPGRIEKIGTTWLIHPKVYTGTSQLIPFPYEIVPNVQDQEALLTYQSCSSAVSNMHEVVKALLRGKWSLGLYSKIDEVSHFVKGAKHNLRRVVPNEGRNRIDATDYAHTVIRVTVKNGDVYVLDMAGAQYGWHEPVIPWQLYSASRVRGIKSVVPFGETRVFCKQRAQNLSEQQNWIHSIKESFAESVDYAVAKWQMANISSSDLLRLPDQEFLERQASLLDAVDGFMQQYKTFSESQGNYNISQGFQHGGLDRKITMEHRPSFSEWLAFMRDGTTPSG